MRYHLKNRPHLKYPFPQGYGLHQYWQSVEAWFRHFEKELKELAKSWEGLDYHGIESSPDLNIIREILGES